jgi:hypothetical protein
MSCRCICGKAQGWPFGPCVGLCEDRVARSVIVGAAALLVALCAILVEAIPGFAAVGHPFVSSLSEAPAGTLLGRTAAVAVDQGSGRVFVGDPESGMVDVYSASGVFVTQFGGAMLSPAGVAVDEASGEVYVADYLADELVVFKPDGPDGYQLLARWYGEALGTGEFGRVSGVAVDNSGSVSAGDVYVVDAGDVVFRAGAVDVFKPRAAGPEEALEGTLVRKLASGKMEAPNGVAVSRSTGRVLVADSVKGAIFAFGPSGEYEEQLSGSSSPNGPFSPKGEEPGNVAAVAVAAGTGDVYVAESERHAVSQYGASGEWKGWITTTPSGDLGEPRGVALAPEEEVYVADASSAVVDRFGPAITVPSVETEKAAKSGLTRTSAALPGTVNGEEKPASYRFQYGDTEALGSETASAPVSGTGTQAVTATAEELQAGHAYYYRIVGENAAGAAYGLIRALETRPAVDALETDPAVNPAPEGVTLTGSLKREGLVTHYYFQYGTSDAYGKQAPEPPGIVPAGSDEREEKEVKTLETNVSGLSANTVYHYRIVADNSYGTTYGRDRTFTTPGPPSICSEPATAIGQQEATVHACVNPDRLATTYHFEYGETTAYGTEVPLEGQSIGSGSTAVAVSATVTGLKVGTTYHYRAVATNEAGTAAGPDRTFTTVPPAPVEATYATGITATEVTLNARINPLGNDTRYYFQYGSQSCRESPNACANTPAPPGGDIGSGSEGLVREARISGLQPDTTYHFRVLASNTLGQTEGSEHTFTTQREAAFGLPDGRAFEMVTPPEKEGAPVEALTREGGLILASEDGNALTYVAGGALGEEVEGNRSPEWQQIMATRGKGAWSSQDIATPSSKEKGVEPGSPPEYEFFTPHLSRAVVEPAGRTPYPPLAPGVTQATVYLRDNAGGTYLPLVTDANVAPGTVFGGEVHFVSATPDLSHVVIKSGVALTGGRSRPGLYEWSEGNLRFVSVLPGGKPAHEPELGYFHIAAHAISSDGSRIIWTTPEENSHRGHLYMRDILSGETIQLDAAQGVVEPGGIGVAQFQTATSDGSRVFFTDAQRLVPDSTAEPLGNEQKGEPDLYECAIVEEEDGKLACRLEDLTVDFHEGEHADVQGLLFGVSEDGASVYLIAQGVLASNENGNGETALPGEDNLYELHHDGTQWSRTFLATLSEEDRVEWSGNQIANTTYLTARVSPNGRYLAFMSAAPLTGYDNVDANPAAEGARDEEVFLYDSVAGRLRCVSCNPSGSRPAGVLDTKESGEGLGLIVDRRQVWLGRWLAGNVPGWTARGVTSALFQSRYLSDDGRLYFDSPDSLVPAAKNGKEDVYQYEPSGVGSCQSPTGGCVSLISGGSSDRESAFVEATPGGSNVFFLTEARLLPAQDLDTAFDIYDARECTVASPCLTSPEASPPGCGETDTCRPAEPAQQIAGGASGSETFFGTGNVTSAPPAAKHESKARKTSKQLTRAQKLKRALKSCRKRNAHAKRKRRSCERKARRRYRHRHATKKSKRKASHRSKARGSGRARTGR